MTKYFSNFGQIISWILHTNVPVGKLESNLLQIWGIYSIPLQRFLNLCLTYDFSYRTKNLILRYVLVLIKGYHDIPAIFLYFLSLMATKIFLLGSHVHARFWNRLTRNHTSSTYQNLLEILTVLNPQILNVLVLKLDADLRALEISKIKNGYII